MLARKPVVSYMLPCLSGLALWLNSAQDLQDLNDAEARDDAEACDVVVRLLSSQKTSFCRTALTHS